MCQSRQVHYFRLCANTWMPCTFQYCIYVLSSFFLDNWFYVDNCIWHQFMRPFFKQIFSSYFFFLSIPLYILLYFDALLLLIIFSCLFILRLCLFFFNLYLNWRKFSEVFSSFSLLSSKHSRLTVAGLSVSQSSDYFSST